MTTLLIEMTLIILGMVEIAGERANTEAKYDSGTGWPSFTRALEPRNIVEKQDRSLFTTRTEIRSKQADSHSGTFSLMALNPRACVIA